MPINVANEGDGILGDLHIQPTLSRYKGWGMAGEQESLSQLRYIDRTVLLSSAVN